MGKTSVKMRFIVPLLAFVLAFACAPAAFAVGLQAGEADGDAAQVPDLTNATINMVGGTSFVYTGQPITPAFSVTLNGTALTRNTDYWYFYDDNVNVGDALVCAYNDEAEEVTQTFGGFAITPAPIKSTSIKVTNEVYTGKVAKPDVSITYNGTMLKQGTDYTVKYGKRKKVGTGKVTITGMGNFTGTVKAKFKITKASIKDVKTNNVKDQVYTGKKLTPKVTLKFKGKKLKKGKDYTIKYTKNTNVGIAKIKIKGKGNYKGKRTIQFAIHARSINQCSISTSYSQYWWTGSDICPAVTVKYNGRTLSQGRDYTVRYTNNRHLTSDARIYVRGINNFNDLAMRTFSIVPFNVSYATITPSTIPNQKFDGTYKYPSIQVKQEGRTLVQGVDYRIDYYNNQQVGRAQIVITGLTRYCTGTKSIYFNIVK